MANKAQQLVNRLLGEAEPAHLRRQRLTFNLTRSEAQWLWNNLSIAVEDGSDPEAEVITSELEREMSKLWPEPAAPEGHVAIPQ